jgi:hypothetical protein
MLLNRPVLTLAASACLGACGVLRNDGITHPDDAGPTATVTRFYRLYSGPDNWTDPRIGSLVSPLLIQAVLQEYQQGRVSTSTQEVPHMSFDPVLSTQELIWGYEVGGVRNRDDTAVVELKIFPGRPNGRRGEPWLHEVYLSCRGGRWVIEDFGCGRATSGRLMDFLRENDD